MWLTHFWHSWSQFFIFAWDVTAGGILRTGVLICLVWSWKHSMIVYKPTMTYGTKETIWNPYVCSCLFCLDHQGQVMHTCIKKLGNIGLDNGLSRVFGMKPFSEPVLVYCQDHKGHISVKSHFKFRKFHWRKFIWKYNLKSFGDFVSALTC